MLSMILGSRGSNFFASAESVALMLTFDAVLSHLAELRMKESFYAIANNTTNLIWKPVPLVEKKKIQTIHH